MTSVKSENGCVGSEVNSLSNDVSFDEGDREEKWDHPQSYPHTPFAISQ